MRGRQRILFFVLIIAATVVVTDLMVQTTLLRTVWPVVIEPPNDAVVTPPVTVRWEGPRRLSVTLVGGGSHEQLGLRSGPFVLTPEYFPRPGQYRVQLRSPFLPWFSPTECRFRVGVAPAAPALPAPTPPVAPPAQQVDHVAAIARLRTEIDAANAENAALQEDNARLREQRQELEAALRDLHAQREEEEDRHAALAQQQAELLGQQEALAEENRELRQRLGSIPPCASWGYLSYPRPQTVPAIGRFVVVSDARGRVFENPLQCEAARRSDRGAASACVCVGPTLDR